MGSPFGNFLGGGVGISTGISLGTNNLGLSIGINTQSLPIPGQTFRTIPLPNFQPAIYGLAIRGSFGALIGGFTFPLSPSSLRKEYMAMSNIYDVAGNASQGGVNRVMDSYGVTPVVFSIEGTTGWQYHSTDGYSETGLQAIAALEQFFFQYAQLNEAQITNNQPPYTMEFYDYFRGDFWQVEPWGPQAAQMTNQRPMLVYYRYRLAGILNLTLPIAAENDQVSNVLSGSQQPANGIGGGVIDAPQGNVSTPNAGTGFPTGGENSGASSATQGIGNSSNNLQNNYNDITPGALGGSQF